MFVEMGERQHEFDPPKAVRPVGARYRDADGEQRGKTFDTKGAAREFLASVRVEIQRGEYVDPNRGRVPVESVSDDRLAVRSLTTDVPERP